MKLVSTYIILICLNGAGFIYGQVDTLIQLKEVEVTARRIDLSDIGKHTDRIDSQILMLNHHHNLASLLSAHTPLFVRSYGAGTLATLGIRGGGAAHTQILWNGIPLRNPMIGLVDLALLPIAFIDEASVHYGGHGAAFGSGAIGGLISISNHDVSTTNGIHLGMGIGSWENRYGNMQLDYGTDKIRFSSRLFSQAAENNYRYKLNKTLPERTQVHHRLANHGLLQEMKIFLSEQNSMTARVWYQYAGRQIPPTSTQTTSKAAQQDESVRASIQWNHQHSKVNWQIKSIWLDETIDFQDTLILLYTHNRFRTWLAEGETSFRLTPALHMTGGVYTEVAEGESANYSDVISRNQTALFSSMRLLTHDWIWRLEAREEVTGGSWSPFLFDLAAEWTFIKNATFKTSISRNYRVPTLNDLNWRPGGNPELTPEDGWTYEAGAYYSFVAEKFSLTTSVTGYTRKIDDWIMWMPPIKDVRNYWAPINVAQVLSKGIETRGHMYWAGKKIDLDLRVGIDLTWSRFGTPLQEFGIEAGEQLFYVPVENAMTGLKIHFKNWILTYDHHWFGPSTGINDQISKASIGSGGLNFRFGKKEANGVLFFQVDNIWNVPYRIIERRPMPGRGLSGGVKFSFS